MNSEERFAVAQAVYDLAGAMVATRTPGNLRAELDAAAIGLWEEHGVKSKEIRVNGQKVGTLSLTVESRPQVEDGAEWREWMLLEGHAEMRDKLDLDVLSERELATLTALAKSVNPDAVRSTFTELRDWKKGLVHDGRGNAVDPDGCVVPGVRWVERVKSTTVRGCKPQDVAKALGGNVDVFALLEGGAE